MDDTNFKKGTKDNFTHIKFYYDDDKIMRVNKFTYVHVYPNEKKVAKKFEYQVKIKDD